jgi:hypothetical protein
VYGVQSQLWERKRAWINNVEKKIKITFAFDGEGIRI